MRPTLPALVLVVCLSLLLSAGCLGLPEKTTAATSVNFTTERSSKLLITNNLDQPLSVRVTPHNTSASEPFSHRYPPDRDRIELTGLFADNVTYEIAITTGEKTLWRGTKRPDEVFALHIGQDGEVDLRAYANEPDESQPTLAMDNRLWISTALPDNISVTLLLRDGSRSAVFSRTYDSPDGDLVVGDAMASGVSYRVILHSDGRVLWQDTIGPAEGFVLNVDYNGNVTVRTHAEA